MDNISTTNKCRKCNKYFTSDLFSKKRGKITSVCLLCERLRGKKYYENNKEKKLKKNKEYKIKNLSTVRAYEYKYRLKNKEKISKWHKEDKKKNPEKYKKWSKKYASENKEKHRIYLREWRKGRREETNKQALIRYYKNKDKISAQKKKKYNDNKERMHEYQRQWRQAHPESVAKYLEKYRQNNKEKFVIKNQIRRFAKAKNGGKYTLAEWETLCKKYDNKCLACGRQNIKLTVDHVIPLCKGGKNSIDNIQPLCQSCNSKKGKKHLDYRT